MKPLEAEVIELLSHSPVRVVFGPGCLDRLGEFARDEGARHVLLVTDPGIVRAGHVERALRSLDGCGLKVAVFDGARENPTTEHVTAGLHVAKVAPMDLIIGLGGGSAMDCAKGINLLLTNGGEIADYWGEGRTRERLLPMIAVPTTAGTGSEGQSFALISDATTHQKMACGDRRPPEDGGLRPRVALLDPQLSVSQPLAVTAAAGYDAIAHAVETAGTTRRSAFSSAFSQAAWERLSRAYERVLRSGADLQARADMLLGAHLAGVSIELSMLGAAHACANPLTARYGITHGIAVAVFLPHVVRFNTQGGWNPYHGLDADADRLVRRLEELRAAGGQPADLRTCGIPADALEELATLAADQWTARFNPRPVRPSELLHIYRAAYS